MLKYFFASILVFISITGKVNAEFPQPYIVNPLPYFANNTKLVLKLGERKLYLHENNKVIKVFNVSVGKPGWETPIGNFVVTDMLKNPGWTNFKTGDVVPPGKNNPLGTRWVEFYKVPNSKDVIGFHGTTDISSIGKNKSHGCIRMTKNDVEYMYDKIHLGTPVIVVK